MPLCLDFREFFCLPSDTCVKTQLFFVSTAVVRNKNDEQQNEFKLLFDLSSIWLMLGERFLIYLSHLLCPSKANLVFIKYLMTHKCLLLCCAFQADSNIIFLSQFMTGSCKKILLKKLQIKQWQKDWRGLMNSLQANL